MSDKLRWFLLGTGNFALEVYDWTLAADNGLNKDNFAGLLGGDDGAAVSILNVDVFNENEVSFLASDRIVNAIAACDVKEKVIEGLLSRGVVFETIIHPTAVVRASTIGQGTVICPNTVIGSHVKISPFVTINYCAGIGHEAELGKYSTISPGVQIGGKTKLGERCFVGLNATIIDQISIAGDVQINAGSVVIGRVRSGKRISGNPAKTAKIF